MSTSNKKAKVTESPSNYDNLENMSTTDLLNGLNKEDATVHKAVKKVLPKIKNLIDEIVVRMKQGGRIFYLGAGTSGRLGVLDASELPPTFGIPDNIVIGLIAGGDTALKKAVEAAEDDYSMAWKELSSYKICPLDTVVGIAASGSTPYVIGGIIEARKNGILTACITCNPDSEVAKEAEIAIEAIVGPEFITGSTRLKAGTAQKMILNMITTTIMIKLGQIKGNKMVHMQLTNKKLIERGIKMIMDETNLNYAKSKEMLLKHGSVIKVLQTLHK
ncbi:N-acetylmuramic acid 6-phosphate etherase [Plebeiibacterium marinum]|uniref:N-acetylmuramic acid 6-phosphate etherase n=1 Tax=Plebeiibacterium marinum TaxID=2992111 RepID=A0AAE3SM33_9BACT|nr:N-acetylmuramic acid 6-phosphate etherase [Plebeiobacterium marinum]MCW3808074.1 N-acetylmuramic acid 6-phosphate etherase [Plebeiobacterium marinum]